jgi:membrane-associated phospholipid phosphatase
VEPLLQWGLDLIVALQQVHPALHGVFRTVTFMGEPEFYLLLLPLLFWCVDFGLGARVAIFLLLSSHLNLSLKAMFQQPRPFDFNPALQLTSAEGYGLPSGHAQSAVVVWGSIAAWAHKVWFWAVAVGLMVLIGISRVYLGVHFPMDVLAGWAIGALSLGLYLTTQKGVMNWLAALGLAQQLLLVLAVPLLLFVTVPVVDTATAMGTLAGAGAGLVLTYRFAPFRARGPWWQRALRFVAGGAIVLLLYRAFKVVFPGEASALYLVFRFLRFGIIGLWGSLGAPWLFRLLRLAPEPEASSS